MIPLPGSDQIRGHCMRRREFITFLGGAAATWPVAARAQQQAMPVIGMLDPRLPEQSVSGLRAFRRGLRETGYIEGETVAIDYRWGENQPDRLPVLAAELVRRRVAVIVTTGGAAAHLAAKAATTTIPIVFSTAIDPVQAGLVSSLNRPGGNITGVNFMSVELMPKRLGLLHELRPGVTRFALLVNPNDPNTEPVTKSVQAAALTIGRQIEVLAASTNRDIDVAFAALVQKRFDGLLVPPGPLFVIRRIHLVSLAMLHKVPTIYTSRDYPAVGGLMSYGTHLEDLSRQAGIYTGRILKGEKPADLPVMQPTKFELVINLQTARLHGIEVPPTLLATADEVIE
jgi:putative tryptophan/tyrosine transport system substrate-binding protein